MGGVIRDMGKWTTMQVEQQDIEKAGKKVAYTNWAIIFLQELRKYLQDRPLCSKWPNESWGVKSM